MADVENKKKRKTGGDVNDEEPRKKVSKKAKPAADAGSAEPQPKKSAPKRIKPYSKEEQVVANGASMERNTAIANFIRGIQEGYKAEQAWFKVSSAKKAIDAVVAQKEPIKTARDMLVLPGVGKSTAEKVEQFLRENPNAGGSSAGAFGVSASVDKAGPDDSWVRDSEREVIIDLLSSGDITLDRVRRHRQDIREGDF